MGAGLWRLASVRDRVQGRPQHLRQSRSKKLEHFVWVCLAVLGFESSNGKLIHAAKDRKSRTARSSMGRVMVLVTSAMGSTAAQQRSEGEETPAGILAVRLRQQGYRCDEPTGAKPDPARSRADERAWVVRCANATYRMRLIPDRGAVIEPLN